VASANEVAIVTGERARRAAPTPTPTSRLRRPADITATAIYPARAGSALNAGQVVATVGGWTAQYEPVATS